MSKQPLVRIIRRTIEVDDTRGLPGKSSSGDGDGCFTIVLAIGGLILLAIIIAA